MNYIFDINLNFNDNYFDFFDWNKNDLIIDVRKIPIFKVRSNVLNDFKNYMIKLDSEFVNRIKNKTEYYLNRTIKLMTSFLITDGISIMAIKIDKKLKFSSLQIADELDILEELDLKESFIKYERLNKLNIDEFKTRKQVEQHKIIKQKIENIFNEKNNSKIKYIYYECFGEKEEDINKIYERFIKELNNKKVYLNLDKIAFN